MQDLKGIGKDELLAELEKCRASLEDVQDERMFTLGQTGMHLGASRVAALRAQWDREEQALKERIAAIQALLEEE
ncbi:MAG: hypothetical protein M1343_03685 [Chloroflexi bacterium]|nr:hypothetical protein [Chloroflexota bacterium]MDA8188780.1 hypothetical protein [Dehalococcoidales bacterium]